MAPRLAGRRRGRPGIEGASGNPCKLNEDQLAQLQAALDDGLAVWFDQAQSGGIYHQDWRLENNPARPGQHPAGAADVWRPREEPERPR